MQRNRLIYFLFTFSSLFLLSHCHQSEKNIPSDIVYLNVSDTVRYVGKMACKTCHEKEFGTFMESGMGKSFDRATHEKSAADFSGHISVYDTLRNFYYTPFWSGDTMKIKEFRLHQSDTIYQRVENISFIVGSGHHTNSHMININGFVYQAPLTFYTQEGRWDLPPGFRQGDQTRFDRSIQFECMTCHNGLPELAFGSENKFNKIPSGVTCERCHGPGSMHVREMKQGNGVDTSTLLDVTIVNPTDLSISQQMSLCQRCHLQGPTVLQAGKSFMDFKPSMNLGDVMDVFLPEYEHLSGSFIMASHADRLRQSACYAGGNLSCINCHNPHSSGPEQQLKQFQNACLGCHQREDCTEAEAKEDKRTCFSCHMPTSPSIDIPHVHITDHRIQKPGSERVESAIQNPFKRLKCMTNNQPDNLLMARGYMRFYEGFNPDEAFLDSASYFLEKVTSSSAQALYARIHFNYLKNDWERIIQVLGNKKVEDIDEPYTLYRIGEAFYRNNQIDQAILFTKKAWDMRPLIPSFANRLGSLYVLEGHFKEAQHVFKRLLDEQADYVPILGNLGILKVNDGHFDEGIQLLQRALSLDPDYILAYENLVKAYLSRFDKQSAIETINIWLLNQPDNTKALNMKKEIQ